MHTQHQLRMHEHGGVLVIGLLTLILLTAICLAATTSSITENDISANERQYKEAFYAAETALKVGEGVVKKSTRLQDLYEPHVDGHYEKGMQAPWDAMKWDGTDSVEILPSSFPSDYQKFAVPLRYTIAERNFDLDSFAIGFTVPIGVNLFNVAGQGTGGHKKSKAIVRSIYVRRFS